MGQYIDEVRKGSYPESSLHFTDSAAVIQVVLAEWLLSHCKALCGLTHLVFPPTLWNKCHNENYLRNMSVISCLCLLMPPVFPSIITIITAIKLSPCFILMTPSPVQPSRNPNGFQASKQASKEEILWELRDAQICYRKEGCCSSWLLNIVRHSKMLLLIDREGDARQEVEFSNTKCSLELVFHLSTCIYADKFLYL